ncbi:MAG: CRISPR-associated endonuclease Cas3'', partial [Phycisphaerae bacterium]|nr:CRISPR-associated endonuclease Cas3'' [Phycisphaerae bacterium]
VSMTATPSREVPEGEIERDREEDHADPRLGPRIRASKPARLVVADRAVGRNWRSALVKELVKHARARMESGCRAVGVIVNRVATARETAASLQGNDVEVVLLTGRMRPMDRDDTLKKIEPLLSGGPGDLPKPTFVVATQCLEVGADLDFHALVTECASLDALRQRFGRLNRVAARSGAKAVIVVRGDQIEPTDDLSKQDPVYGNSLANTWKWLNENKDGVDDETGPWIDFSVASIRAKWDTLTADRQAQLNAPVNDAAVLLPAHLDMWCQSNPIPLPDPDPAVFLHGPSRSTPDVQVVFRADLGNDQTEWPEIASLCPPSSAESLPVRIDVFKRWISREDTVDESSDVEGESILDREEPEPTGRRAVLRWQGPDSSETGVIASPAEVRPGGLYVVPIAVDSNLCLLGDFPNSLPTDQGDVAFQRARDRAILRLTPTVLHIPSLAGVTVDDDAFEAKLSDALRALASDPRDWVQRAAENLSRRSKRVVKPHPLGGFVLVGKKRLGQFDPTFVEADESSESVSDRPVVLTDHCRRVADFARRFADRCGLKAKQVDAVEWAGLLHDIGKADPRFQALLHGGNRRKADVFPYLLAKSIGPVPSNRERQLARERAGYPPDARHELLAVRLAESNSVLPPDPDDRDMVLHLIASHHGWCRPFAPVVRDANPTNVIFKDAERTLQASSATGLERLDSGVAERFWKLTRRFGWWGLPWLEAMVRLADWAASEAVAKEDHP